MVDLASRAGRFWRDTQRPRADIIVFAPSKSTVTPYRSDEENFDA
jgi:hypothetical protein